MNSEAVVMGFLLGYAISGIIMYFQCRKNWREELVRKGLAEWRSNLDGEPTWDYKKDVGQM